MAEDLKPREVIKSDIQPIHLDPEDTGIIIQRHEEYIRDPQHPEVGSLKPEANQRISSQTSAVINPMLEALSPDERATLDVMVIGSPTDYLGKGQRSMETAATILQTIKTTYDKFGLSADQILNTQSRLPWNGGVIPSNMIVEPKIFKDNPDFVKFVMEHAQTESIGLPFFLAYEGDQDPIRSKRIEMKAEGPMDMADRLANFLYAMKLYSDKYHREHQGRRLLIWSASHYDTISPYLKSRLRGSLDGHIPVDYGDGFGIKIKPDGTASTIIGGESYSIPLDKTSTASSID